MCVCQCPSLAFDSALMCGKRFNLSPFSKTNTHTIKRTYRRTAQLRKEEDRDDDDGGAASGKARIGQNRGDNGAAGDAG